MEGDFEGEVFVGNCIWLTRPPHPCCRLIPTPGTVASGIRNNHLGSSNGGFPDGNSLGVAKRYWSYHQKVCK